MKKLIFLFIFIPSLLGAQEYKEFTLFDLKGLTSDTTRPISYKPDRPGALVEIDFTTTNCDLLTLDIGYGTNSFTPVYLDTIPGADLTLPVTLDKTTYTNTYLGVESNVISFDITWYDANYLWFHVGYNAACTHGKIKIRLIDK